MFLLTRLENSKNEISKLQAELCRKVRDSFDAVIYAYLLTVPCFGIGLWVDELDVLLKKSGEVKKRFINTFELLDCLESKFSI